jgi:hypothetical protein
MTAEFIYSYGAVRLEVTGMAAGGGGLVVKRGLPAGPQDAGPWHLESIRGFDNAATWPGPGASAGLVYDFEMPLGIVVHYVLVPAATTTASAADAHEKVSVATPGNLAWLRDPMQPVLSQPVWVVSTDPEARTGRQTIYSVVNKKAPVVVWDVRQARSGTVQLLVRDEPGDFYQQTRRDAMDLLLDSGRPLLLSLCASKDFDPCWMAIQDVTYTRVGSGATWTLDLAYNEVDNPVALGITIPPEMTYEVGLGVPVAGATYQDWFHSTTAPYFHDYYDLVEGSPKP